MLTDISLDRVVRQVAAENYGLAATTRNKINLIRAQDPVAMLQSALETAVAEERYQVLTPTQQLADKRSAHWAELKRDY
jgi:hypothetical protein